MNNNEVELITVDELCELLQCGYSTAYKLLSQNMIPSFRIGRIWKIPKEGVDKFILEQSGLSKTTTNPFV